MSRIRALLVLALCAAWMPQLFLSMSSSMPRAFRKTFPGKNC